MDFAEEKVDSPLYILEYRPGECIRTATTEFTSAIVLFNEFSHATLLPSRPEDLQASHFSAMAELGPGLILLGTGGRQHFPPPVLLEPLFKKRIGFEAMNTESACHTFNLLLAENRPVLAALFINGL